MILSAQNASDDAFARWSDDKFSMFIHFGLYSHLGGVWDGEPVRSGYSEQIQSFAGIFSDWYAMTADEFDPKSFDAREIVALAKKAGMRSVVFTTKHHDGFCMFDTATTDYDSVDRTPAGRDYVRELSEACAEAGMKFCLYFSLIDWNFPHAYPISSHNADFVTPQHHEFNLSQVRELLTSYGPISELWFDMGSLQPCQSRDLYALVKELQPDCMVSGRLGNDVYDFAVMADNKLPDVALHAPWQSAASMFPETWSYRSWQARGEVDAKVAEKLRSLIDVVSRGGNYLLNIGPDGDGAVVPFEREVLLRMGRWLEENGEAIYGAEPSPFAREFSWGDVTAKGSSIYLLLTGAYPGDGVIRLPVRNGECAVEVTELMYADPADVHVIKLDLDSPVRREIPVIADPRPLSWKNATPDFSYSCFDYYSNYRSVVAYNWSVQHCHDVGGVELEYASSDVGKKVRLQVGDRTYDITLSAEVSRSSEADVKVVSRSMGRMRGGIFDRPVTLDGVDWVEMETASCLGKVSPFSNHLMKVVMHASKPSRVQLSLTSGNGVELLVYDAVSGKLVPMMKHLNPYGSKKYDENVILDLTEGTNTVVVRFYNRFEREMPMSLDVAHDAHIYRQKVIFDVPVCHDEPVPVRISNLDEQSEHADCKLHNLSIDLIR